MRIAALDDEPRQLELIRHAMAVIGHECHGFEDGHSQQRALYQQSFDMLILDWRLPDVEGSDVVRWIREKLGSRLPILFVAGRRKEEDMVEALTLGADDSWPSRFALPNSRPGRRRFCAAPIRRCSKPNWSAAPTASSSSRARFRSTARRSGSSTASTRCALPVPQHRPPAVARAPARSGVGCGCGGHFALARHAHVAAALEAGPALRERSGAVGRLRPRLSARVHRPEWRRVALPHGGRAE